MMRLIVLKKIKCKINIVNNVKIIVYVNKLEAFKNHKLVVKI